MSGIQFFEDAFDRRLCSHLLADARSRINDRGAFTRSNMEWDENIRKSSAVVLVRDYDEAIAAIILTQLKGRGLIDHEDFHVMCYAWTRLSFIPWHDDARQEEALTIYLNEKWQIDWGGLFLYRDENDDIRGYAPRFNCGIKNDSHVLHATTPVAFDAPEPRFTVQLFSKRCSAADLS